MNKEIDISVVLPTLNEEKTISTCIEKIKKVFKEQKLNGEIIVSDSSTDKTPIIAKQKGAKVVYPKKKGYGRAYIEGFKHAKGKIIVMGDADNTYDFLEIPKLIKPIQEGKADFVFGSRLRGEIKKGAMPWHHKYIGNPVLTFIFNKVFNTNISDTHSGFRAFTKKAYNKLELRTTGMEFASELFIEAVRKGLRIAEVPITYYPRRGEPSKLSSFGDGWRHLRFMLLYRPTKFLLFPGISSFLLALLTYFLFYIRSTGSNNFAFHSLIFGSLFLIIGVQFMLTGVNLKIYSVIIGNSEKNGFIKKVMDYHSLEKEILLSILLIFAGFLLGFKVIYVWARTGFNQLSQIGTAILSFTFISLGFQILFSSIFVSLFMLKNGEN